jgi:3'-phosphoadenosine 5'-phosphosulfate sulfotransferase (PAPS reductase)/FAD synthetase
VTFGPRPATAGGTNGTDRAHKVLPRPGQQYPAAAGAGTAESRSVTGRGHFDTGLTASIGRWQMPYDPFDLDQPALIAFSGGRTSAYMVRRILDSAGGRLPAGVRAVFCNTGKERPETLDFVRDCQLRWGVEVVWLEYRFRPGGDPKHTFAVVDYTTASRRGEPFEDAIKARSFLPNRVARYCTAELKVKTMWRWAKTQVLDGYTKAVGLRADEPGRVSRLLAGTGETRSAEHLVCPLAEAGVTVADVMTFWQSQPFDLRLRPDEGNCDLCFLKRKGTLKTIMHERPDLAAWWVAQEQDGKLFRSLRDRPRYSLLLAEAGQPTLFDDDEDLPCACTD